MAKCYFYNENCYDTIQRMIAKSFKVDLILSSPPYNSGRKSNSKRSLENYEARYDVYLDDMTDDEYGKWLANLFLEFDKILIPNGVILWNISYGNETPMSFWKFIEHLHNDTPFMIAEWIPWKKKCALPNNVSHNKLTRITEPVFVICRKDEYKTFNAYKKLSSVSKTGQKYYENVYAFIEAANNDGSCKLNKATYSSDLCLQLLRIYAKEDSIIYDPFMGTGTTAVACDIFNPNTNMMCIGSELSEAQVEYSKQRLNEHRNK